MKKIFLSLILALGMVFSIVSCTTDAHDPVAVANEKIAISSPSSGTFTLTPATASNEAFVAKWMSSSLGYDAAINYTLQVVKSTANFETGKIGSFDLGNFPVSTNTELTKSITNRQLNAVLLAAEGSIGTEESYKLRIIGKPTTQVANAVNSVVILSDDVTFKGNPYDTFDEFNKIYVPGNFGGASGFSDWNPANAPTLYSTANDGKYSGFVYMNNTNPAFKFTPVPAWSNDKGENNSSGAFSGILGTASDIKPADGAGTYYFTVDWNALTYTMAKRQVAIIGGATPNGWGTPTYLDFDTNPASPYYKMYTKDLALTNDEFLIRLKDDWSEKMGNTVGGTQTVTVGGQYKIKLAGDNMKVPTAGNYKVVLDIRNAANYNLRLMPN